MIPCRQAICLFVLAVLPACALAQSGGVYYPGATWERKTPLEAGISGTLLKDAVDFAVANESKAPRDLKLNHYQTFGREPFGYAIGPIREREAPAGIIVHKGYIVAEWGDPLRVEMTHSVTKSFLSSVVGLAFDRGLIRNIHDPVRDYVPPIQAYGPAPVGNKSDALGTSDFLYLFESPHNRTITWDHLLRQVSDWEGTLWGKPDWADRPGNMPGDWTTRARHKPGSVYTYNDTRVDVLALAALNVWRRPLPQVLKEYIMDPIGASNVWRWYGYENSWIVLDGNVVQSVTGGGHWGGGMFIHALDMARFGYLMLRQGRWNDRQLISRQWMEWAETPTPAQPTYGFMNFFLNTDRRHLPSAPAGAITHIGNGVNMIYVDREHDVVAVARWIDSKAMDEFVKRLLAALERR